MAGCSPESWRREAGGPTRSDCAQGAVLLGEPSVLRMLGVLRPPQAALGERLWRDPSLMCQLLVLVLEWVRQLQWRVLLPTQLLCDPLLRVLRRMLLLAESEHAVLADPAPRELIPGRLDGDPATRVHLRLALQWLCQLCARRVRNHLGDESSGEPWARPELGDAHVEGHQG